MSQLEQQDEVAEPGSPDWWASHRRRLARRRPHSGGLTVERIVAEALAFVDEAGLDALTVRSLADRLGTSSATLYRHVASKDELLVLVIDHILGEVQQPSTDLSGRDRVIALSMELRRVLLAHTNVVPALRAAPLFGPNAMSGAEAGLQNLLDMGLHPALATKAYLAMVDYVLGTVFFGSAGHTHGSVALRDGLASSVPVDHRAMVDASIAPEVFELGLLAMLDGIEARNPPGDH